MHVRRPAGATNLRGFTLIDLIVVVVAVGLFVVGVLLVMPGIVRERRMAQNAQQVRGIHQALVASASSSRKFANLAYPGLESATDLVIPDGPPTYGSGAGSVPAARFAILLNSNYFQPDELLNPADPMSVPAVTGPTPVPHVLHPASPNYRGVHAGNHSYALMALPGTENERAEWRHTFNREAVVLADRAVGSEASTSSVWTRSPGAGWHGHLARNDNAVSFAESPTLTGTRYGSGTVNATDHLFVDDPTADDAFLVHESATAGFSSR